MKTSNVMLIVKVVMAIALLLCLAHMPYGYYVLVRFVAMVVFAVMAYLFYKEENGLLMVLFGALALLFQPFVKIALGRVIWNIIDVAVAGLLVYLVWKGLHHTLSEEDKNV